MKILEIMGSLHRGGAETMIMNYYRAFDKELCQMDFIIHAEFDKDYRAEAIKMGAKIFLLPRPGKIGIFKYIFELTRKINENGPYDAIHIHTNYQAFLSIIAARICKIGNIIVHSHTTSYSYIQLLLNRFIMRIFHIKRLACGIAAGDAFFGKNNYSIISNAIDVSKFSTNFENKDLKKLSGQFSGRRIIEHLGSFTYQKSNIFLIDVLSELPKIIPDILFLLYGSGKLEDKVRKYVSKKGLDEKVCFMGVIEDASEAYQLFDIFALPSLYEGFPVTLIEAQVARVYSFTSDAVSKECDLNVNLIKFLPLNVSLWTNEIYFEIYRNTNKLLRKSDNDVSKYDVNIQWKELYTIYALND